MPPQQEIHCYYLKKMENEQTWLGVLHKEKRTTLKKNEKKKKKRKMNKKHYKQARWPHLFHTSHSHYGNHDIKEVF